MPRGDAVSPPPPKRPKVLTGSFSTREVCVAHELVSVPQNLRGYYLGKNRGDRGRSASIGLKGRKLRLAIVPECV